MNWLNDVRPLPNVLVDEPAGAIEVSFDEQQSVLGDHGPLAPMPRAQQLVA
jgi:hypothetical protein